MKTFGIIGAGAWGTALAVSLDRAGMGVWLWGRDADHISSLTQTRENQAHLPGIPLAADIRPTALLAEVAQADALILAAPAQSLRAIMRDLAPLLPSGQPLIIAAKGIEAASGLLLSEIAAQELPHVIPAILTGPTFAEEVARNLPSVITLAIADDRLGRALVQAMGTATFRPYLSGDLIGAQVGGAVKNVLAIACGIVEGRGLGDNARAALITRGLAELTRFAAAKGGHMQTMMGPAGLGDLVLTASSAQSRNYSLGFDLGRGIALDQALARSRGVTEGVWTAGIVVKTASALGLDVPLSAAVDSVINGGQSLDKAIRGLLARPFRFDGQ